MNDRRTDLEVAAVCLTDAAGRLLIVRKRATTTFMLPGGKVESGELPADAARREAWEETGVVVPEYLPELLGIFSAVAANETGLSIRAHVFDARGADAETASACAEIEEIRWLAPDEAETVELAPLLRDSVLPELRRRPVAGRRP